ncbi:MAG TPA: class I SAM-dependent methyltransferase [Anaerolineae bacterium]|nr:class I SAM-dependent methyltransferase [Anaerolineae bacterium]
MSVNITDVVETLVLPLYLRAREAQRRAAIIQDEKSTEAVRQLDYDFTWIDQLPGVMSSQVAMAIRTEIFDDVARGFLQRHPAGTIVNLGAGLCTRFYRLANEQAHWVELDFEPVIEMRRRLFPDTPRHVSLACSVLDFAWMERVKQFRPEDGPILFIAEGVLYYLELTDVKQLLLATRQHFTPSELVFDAVGPVMIKSINRGPLSKRFNTIVHWGVRDFREVEQWCSGLRFLESWSYLDRHTKRWGMMKLIKWIPPLKQQLWRIAHFRFDGETT